MVRNFNKLFLLLTVTSLFLCSCSSVRQDAGPASESHTSAQMEHQTTVSQDEAVNSAQHYLDLAGKSTVPQTYEYQIMAAEAFFNAGELQQAEHWLNQAPPRDLPARLQAHHALILAQIAYAKQDYPQTLNGLNAIRNPKVLSRKQQEQYFNLLATSYTAINKPLESAQARSQLDEILLMPYQKKANQEALWKSLSRASNKNLEALAQSNDKDAFTGWVQLAYLLRTAQVSGLNQATRQWRQDFPNHPGQKYLGPQVDEVAQYRNSQITYPKQIALLLPLSGTHKKAAEAIRDGFLTRYYSNSQFQLAKPSIRIYDTTAVTDMKHLYLQAVEEGAQFVIGPLMKENVYELSSLSRRDMRVPILALNQNKDIKNIPPYFYQFALSPENEAEQLAQFAAQKQLQNAVVVVPNNKWGTRIIDSFGDRYSLLGGHVVSTIQVSSNEDQAKAVRELLNVENSRARSQAIKYSIREKVHFQPRRRQDIDVIIMAAPPEQARQIKPLFDFYFAQDIPVLATSSVYSGTPDPSKDRDMNEVVFCDMPWLLANAQQEQTSKDLITQHWPSESSFYARLYAMGVDAFELSARMNQLSSSRQNEYPGATGYLSLGPNQMVERRLLWAQFKDGKPNLLGNS